MLCVSYDVYGFVFCMISCSHGGCTLSRKVTQRSSRSDGSVAVSLYLAVWDGLDTPSVLTTSTTTSVHIPHPRRRSDALSVSTGSWFSPVQ